MVHGGRWSDKELEILKENYPKKNIDELMILLPDRCDLGIKTKARRLGIKKE